MTFEPELVESIDKLGDLIAKFQTQLISGDLNEFTLRQLYYIELIHKNNNISVSEIANELNVKKSTVSIAINQMMEKGILTKIQSDKDKRVYFLQLTSKGQNIMELHMKIHENAINHIKKVLTPEEVKNFIIIINKLASSKL